MVFTSNLMPSQWCEYFNEDESLRCALDRIFDDAVNGAMSSPDSRYSFEKKKYEFSLTGFQHNCPISRPQSMTLSFSAPDLLLAIVLSPYPLLLMVPGRQIRIQGLFRNQLIKTVQKADRTKKRHQVGDVHIGNGTRLKLVHG